MSAREAKHKLARHQRDTKRQITHRRISVEEKSFDLEGLGVPKMFVDLEKGHKKTVVKMLNKPETKRFEGIRTTFNQKLMNISADTET